MKSTILLFGFFLLLCIISCTKNEMPVNFGFDEIKFKKGIIEVNDSIISFEINKVTQNLTPKPLINDPLGQKANLDTLLNRINKSKLFKFKINCYGCIQTGYAQTEIVVETDSSGYLVKRILDVYTSDLINLKYAGIHK